MTSQNITKMGLHVPRVKVCQGIHGIVGPRAAQFLKTHHPIGSSYIFHWLVHRSIGWIM